MSPGAVLLGAERQAADAVQQEDSRVDPNAALVANPVNLQQLWTECERTATMLWSIMPKKGDRKSSYELVYNELPKWPYRRWFLQ